MANSPQPRTGNHRLSLDMSSSLLATLDRIGPQLDTTSRAATIRIAIGVLDTVVERMAEGQTLVFRQPDGKFQPVIITTLIPCMPRDRPLIPDAPPE